MITSDFTGLTADLGLPSEAELTGLANQLFTDIDGSLFEPEVCEEGIEKLVTTGDTGVFDTAAQKAQRVFGDLGVSDFEKIASELYVSQQPNEEKTDGFSPRVVSQRQAEQENSIEVRTTGEDNNVISRADRPKDSQDTVGGQKNNGQIIVGTKTLEQIREDFPILREKVNGNPLIWLDNGATTQRPQAVIDRLSYYYEAIEIVSKVCAYTNHTILAEALEKWPIAFLDKAVPQLMPIIRELDNRVRAKVKDESTYIIKDNLVHMAHMDIHYGYSVNGVAYLHTEILKNSELNNFYKLYPEKFNNKTNGITFRRWLMACNPELSSFITELIGEGWKKDANELEKLGNFVNDDAVLTKLLDVKAGKKKDLKNYLKKTQGMDFDENSIFDIQVKRLHEYKRQQMNALYVIHKYFEIKEGKKPETPITVFFGAKAAPAYIIAKDIIHLILCLQQIINNDPEVSPYLKVFMVENYNVTMAEKMIPACDISEQISLASKEASGTGNMKFMLNGAVTLGTMDGANVEIAELVGDDNIFTFGEDSQTVIDRYDRGDYKSKTYYDNDPELKKAVDFIVSDTVKAVGCSENLERLYNELLNKDWFMTFPDFEDYIETREKAYAAYNDRKAWAKKMLVNISKAGFFSSDRTIEQYNKEIWKLS